MSKEITVSLIGEIIEKVESFPNDNSVVGFSVFRCEEPIDTVAKLVARLRLWQAYQDENSS